MKLRTCRNDAQKQVDKGNLGTDTPSVSKQPPNGGFFMPKIVQQKGVKNPDALINGNEYWEFKNSERDNAK